ncbi:MAG: hypothetical protein OEZ06_22355 [Myxococcales bacterium]|nr:hypothetical protein [Myxococcales bacterium]
MASTRGRPVLFFALLAVTGAALQVWAEPGLFTIDESHHLASVVALRHGRLSLPHLEGLTPSDELAFFRPQVGLEPAAPPAITMPPLYAFFAQPFAPLGLRGLLSLNLLSYLATAALLFVHLRRIGTSPISPWLAALCLLLFSHSLEYAVGIWSHSLSVLLCTAAVVLVSRARAGDRLLLFACAGLLCGFATGVRYQNLVFTACVGLTVLLHAPRRGESAVSFGLAAGLPLLANSLINRARLGFYNPVSKGPGYAAMGGGGGGGPGPASAAGGSGLGIDDSLLSALFRVVDYRLRPPQSFGSFALSPDPDSGAFVFYGVAKKALLQSCPWMGLALLLAALALIPRRAGASTETAALRRELISCALPLFGIVALFALAGSARTDGIGFNQRYLLEMVPLAAIILALSLEGLALSMPAASLGAVLGAALPPISNALMVLDLAHRTHMIAPLILAALPVLAWPLRRRAAFRVLFSAALAACLSYAAAIHLTTDVAISQKHRGLAAAMHAAASGRLPERSAVFVWAINRSAVVAEQLHHDLVIVDCSRDQGRDGPRLAAELMARGRRVFILANGFPETARERLVRHFGLRRVDQGVVTYLELQRSGIRAPARR